MKNLLIAVTLSVSALFPQSAVAPIADKRPVTYENHGVIRTDDYAWLRADNWEDVLIDPSKLPLNIRQHLESENKYTETMLAATKELQEKLAKEMHERMASGSNHPPGNRYKNHIYDYYYESDDNYPHYIRSDLDGNNAIEYLDGNLEGKGKDFFNIFTIVPSPNEKYVLWNYDDIGSETYTIKIRSLEDLKDLDEVISYTYEEMAWDANSEGFFYLKGGASELPNELFYHKLGTDPKDDKRIFVNEEEDSMLGIVTTSLNDYIFLFRENGNSNEIYLIPADKPLTKPKLIRPREDNVEYSFSSGGDVLYILTNIDGAVDYKVMVTPIDKPDPENWKDYIPHEEGRMLEDIIVFKDYIVRKERKNGQQQIVVKDRKTNEEHTISFDEEIYNLDWGYESETQLEYDTEVIRFTYSSMIIPTKTYEYNLKLRERKLLSELNIVNYDEKNYVAKKLYAPTEDGTLLPISVVYHKDTKIDGTAPLVLYGYGAYGLIIKTSFDSTLLSLLDRGFVWAIAHIRGGKEMGTNWHDSAKLNKKKNSFNDFITAGRFLVKEKYTNHNMLMAYGASAGGLLMGVVANMAPQDYAAIVAEVPFLDSLTTLLDPTLPLSRSDWTEWGNPVEDKEAFEYIKSYSPYEQISKQAYPAILALGGLRDPRVSYWEPVKWVAKLREYNTGDAPILLKTNMVGGHAGSSGLVQAYRDAAFTYSFFIAVAAKKKSELENQKKAEQHKSN